MKLTNAQPNIIGFGNGFSGVSSSFGSFGSSWKSKNQSITALEPRRTLLISIIEHLM